MHVHYMFEVYLDFAHSYLRIEISIMCEFSSVWFSTRVDEQTIARRREEKISLKCKLESIGLRFITAIIAICFWHFNYLFGSFTPFNFYFIFFRLLWLFYFWHLISFSHSTTTNALYCCCVTIKIEECDNANFLAFD